MSNTGSTEPAPDLKLAVFDFDGTVVDSRRRIVTAAVRAFDDCSLPRPTEQNVLNQVGLSLYDVMLNLLGRDDHEAVMRLVDRYREHYRSMRIDGHLKPWPIAGVLDAMRDLRARGVLLGIATGKSRRGLNHAVDDLLIRELFATLKSSDDGPGKPAPAILLDAMDEAGTDAANTVMIGDTTWDMLMAANAGVRALGVTFGYHSSEELRSAGAFDVLDDYGRLAEVLSTQFTVPPREMPTDLSPWE